MAKQLRGWPLAAVVSGLGVAALVGSGVLAVVSDQIISADNSVTSGTYEPATFDVQGALVTYGEDCGAASYQDGPLGAMFVQQPIASTFDVGEGYTEQGDWSLCFKNAGVSNTGQLELYIDPASVLQTEASCEQDERSAGDACDQADDPGEIVPLLWIGEAGIGLPGSTSTSCSPTGSPTFADLSDGTATLVLDTDLAPGETCGVTLVIGLHAESQAEAVVGQTDTVQWDFGFSLVDVPAS